VAQHRALSGRWRDTSRPDRAGVELVSAYVTRRVLTAIPTLLVIITVAFFMMRIAPGGPFDRERALPPEIEKNVLAAYDLDQPLLRQYADYLLGVLHGDFGPSFKYRDFTVAELLWTGFPASMKVGGLAIVLAVLLGIGFGTLAALRQNSMLDYAVMASAMTGITIPNFVMAPLLTLFFGVYLGWLPVAGWNGGAARNLVLPVIALALPQIAYIARLTRGSMIEVLHTNYIRTARAKGLRERIVVVRHALKGALLPVVSYLGPATAQLVTGSIVIETIFGIPGIGRYFIQGALNRDYTLVLGTVIVYAVVIILLNLVVDLLYGVLDPKVKQR
jgi:oligopeptide transport system permease protein